MIYTRRLLDQLGFPQPETTPIYAGEDNTTCVTWSECSVGGSDRAKHIDVREHFVHEVVDKKILKLEPVESAGNAADLLTEPLLKAPFWPLRKLLLAKFLVFDGKLWKN